MKFLNEKGMSIAEVAVAAGMMGVLSLGLMRMMKMQTDTNVSASNSLEISRAVNEVSLILADKDECATGMSPLGELSLTDDEEITLGKYTKGFVLNPNLKVDSFHLNYKTVPVLDGDVEDGITRMELRMIFAKKKNKEFQTGKFHKFNILATISDKEVTACSGTGEDDIVAKVKEVVTAERERFDALPLDKTSIGEENWVTGQKIIKQTLVRHVYYGNRVDWCRYASRLPCPSGWKKSPSYCRALHSHHDRLYCTKISITGDTDAKNEETINDYCQPSKVAEGHRKGCYYRDNDDNYVACKTRYCTYK